MNTTEQAEQTPGVLEVTHAASEFRNSSDRDQGTAANRAGERQTKKNKRPTKRESYAALNLIATSLEDFLNRKYPLPSGGYRMWQSHYKDHYCLDEVYLAVTSHDVPERNKRAFATLLIQTSDAEGEGEFYIRYRKSTETSGDGWVVYDTGLLIGFEGKDFDAADAMRQVGERMKLLEDDANLKELSPEDLEDF